MTNRLIYLEKKGFLDKKRELSNTFYENVEKKTENLSLLVYKFIITKNTNLIDRMKNIINNLSNIEMELLLNVINTL